MRFPPSQPPSHKSADVSKSQLLRQYQSLLRSSPLILMFQHNNLKAAELLGIRRELAWAMQRVDEELAKNGGNEHIGSFTRFQIVQTRMFAVALKVVEFWNPKFDQGPSVAHPTDPKTATSTPIADVKGNSEDFTHGLSERAYRAVKRSKRKHGLEPLFAGPLATLVLPSVSPQHLKAALSILSPSPKTPAPKRRTNPTYHEPAVQSGLQKLMLLGARVEGKVFDFEGARWIATIDGGLDGLRAQLVSILQGAAAGLATTLESTGRNLYMTVEGRRGMLEEEEKKQEA